MKSLICDTRWISAWRLDAGKSDGVGTNDAVEFTAFVALGISLGVLGLPRAELAKVLCGLGGRVGEELHLHPAQRLS